MTKGHRIDFNAVKRAFQFTLDHTLTAPTLQYTSAKTALGTSITDIETIAGDRNEGSGTFHGAAQQRRFAKNQLRDALSDLSAVSKTLDKVQYPDVAEQLKMRKHANSYQSLLDFARAAVDVVEPMEAVFTDHGSSATLVADLEALIAGLDSAGNRKNSGVGKRIGKGRALTVELRKAKKHVRKLDSILSQIYKDDAGLYSEWKAAKRRERTLPPEETPATDGSGTGSGTVALVNTSGNQGGILLA